MRTGFILLLLSMILLAGILFLVTLPTTGAPVPPVEEMAPFAGDGNNWLM